MDKSLTIALLISTILHMAIFLQIPHLKSSPTKKDVAALVVTYLTLKDIPQPKPKTRAKPKRTTIVKEKKIDIVKVQKKKEDVVKLKKKTIKKPADTTVNKTEKIEIPPELPKEKEAVYINYYQSIRGKIREFVVDNYPRFIACGEVCLHFILHSNGKLKQLRIIEERSTPNRSLQEIAKKSVRQAAPFSAFPKDLNQRELSFNVIISFELEK